MIKNILITGGAGFIGSHLALALLDKGYQITVLDNLSHQIHGLNANDSYLFQKIRSKVVFIKGDVRIKSDWEKSLRGQDAVIHLAAETGTGQSMYEIAKYTDVNIGGTALLLDILANNKHTVQKMIIASSRAIYGEGRYSCPIHGDVYPKGRNEENLLKGEYECLCPECGGELKLLSTDEGSKISPQSIYGLTKHSQEQYILLAGRSLKIPAVAFRYQNVYGPGQSLSNPYTGILSVFSTQIKNKKSLNIFEDGKESRDFVYIDDVVEATILGMEKPEANFEVFNVGTGTPTSVLDLAVNLVKAYESDTKLVISGNFRLGDIRHNYADMTKSRRLLGFAPQYQFHEGVSKFVQWVNSQGVLEDKYALSIDEMKYKGLLK